MTGGYLKGQGGRGVWNQITWLSNAWRRAEGVKVLSGGAGEPWEGGEQGRGRGRNKMGGRGKAGVRALAGQGQA